jgi:hypothetical protein
VNAHRLTAAADRSLQEVVAAHAVALEERDRWALGCAVEAAPSLESGLDPRVASARGVFDEPGVGAGDRWLPGGYRQLVDLLAGELPAGGAEVRLGHPVGLVRHGRRASR